MPEVTWKDRPWHKLSKMNRLTGYSIRVLYPHIRGCYHINIPPICIPNWSLKRRDYVRIQMR